MNYDDNNIFAKIIAGSIPADKVYEDEQVIAFRDIAPAAPVHILVIPKEKYISFDDFAKSDPLYIGRFFSVIQKIAAKEGLTDNGYRLITNHGKDASQTVPHFHVHILAGKQLGGLLASDELCR